MAGKTAILFGASGLVGSFLLEQLVSDLDYVKIIAPVRNPLQQKHAKIQEIPLETFEQFQSTGDSPAHIEVFCCLGTTIKKAKSQAAFRQVDFELPVKIAAWSHQSGIQTFIVISSIGATRKTGNFYLRTKGEMEEAVIALGFKNLHIVRPSLLLGKRNEFRFGEGFAQALSKYLSFLFVGRIRKYRAIEAQTVAIAMKILATGILPETIVESDLLEKLVNKNSYSVPK